MEKKPVPTGGVEPGKINYNIKCVLKILFQNILIAFKNSLYILILNNSFQELENLFSEHFGRTPVSTPAASQDNDRVPLSDDADDDQFVHEVVDLDQRAMQFLDETNSLDPDADSSGDDLEAEDRGRLTDIESIPLPQDDPDLCKIRETKARGCSCKSMCISLFSDDVLYNHVLNMREMSKEEKDMYITGSLVQSNKETTKRGKKRRRSRQTFMFSGERVCKTTFMLSFDIGKHFLQNIITHMNTQGVTPRKHGNIERQYVPSHHSLKYEDIRLVVQFISNFADEFGLPQPAALRGRDDVPPIYIPSDMTTKDIHGKYIESCPNDRHVHYSTFCNIWNQCLPHIRIAKPRDDVCATCEKLRKCILDAVSEEDKLEAALKVQDHITHAQTDKKVYNECVKKSRETYHLQDKFVHYTFDFSQNVCIPHHAWQMGPLYFQTLRKVHIFGVRSDGEPKQLYFLINENETIGPDGANVHGPDSVISMLDWALENHHSGETSCTIHADNCCGQNKNQYVLGYFMWRVMTKQHHRIEYKMQVPGHARCLIDGGFALIKKLYRRCDWDDEPGIVSAQKTSGGIVEKIAILKDQEFSFDEIRRPAVLPASGLSESRLRYLFSHVRPYVRPAFQEETCPDPSEVLN
ncbi:uncharacterized protein LOC144623518 [Crassostrea virginica]